ncbi:MAG: ATP-grasp domain-containing protein [Candidatus Hodarchaeales archaeon]|jgi:ribosomal protein S6--L-glutamate ligase
MVKQIGVLSRNKDYFPTTSLLKDINQRNDISGVFLSTQYVFPLISSSGADARFATQSLLPRLGVVPRIGRSQTSLGLLCLKHFELMNIPSTLSAEALFLSRDKFRCYQAISKIKGIQLPRTILINNSFQVDQLLKAFTFPLVIKLPDATRGSGSMLVPNLKNAEEIIESLFMRSSEPIMIQEYLQSGTQHTILPSADIRVVYIGNEIIGSMKRIAPAGEWRTNYALGAQCEAFKLTPEDEELVHQIAERIGIEVAGIDLFPTQNGSFVLEVNACPGWKAFEMANPEINVANKIIDYLMTKIRR